MRPFPRRIARQLLATIGVAVAALTLSACGSDTDRSGATSTQPWATSTAPVSTTELAWATIRIVHFGDGTKVDVGNEFDSWVVAGDGVYSVYDREIWFTKPGEAAVNTGLKAESDSLRASTDGRYLGWIDDASGTKDKFGTPQLEGVVWDLKQGREVLRTNEGMGDPSEGDLADLYEDASGAFIRFIGSDEVVVHQVGDGQTAWKLGGTAQQLPQINSEFADSDPWAQWNPSRTWMIEGSNYGLLPEGKDPETYDMDHFVASDGDTVFPGPDLEGWRLAAWVDDETAVGWAYTRTGPEWDDHSGSLMTCKATTGKCTVVPNTEDEQISLPGAGAR